jgi:hypothetical protein
MDMGCPDFRNIVEKLSVSRRRFPYFIFGYCHLLGYKNGELWKHAHNFYVYVSDLYQFFPKSVFLYVEITHKVTKEFVNYAIYTYFNFY